MRATTVQLNNHETILLRSSPAKTNIQHSGCSVQHFSPASCLCKVRWHIQLGQTTLFKHDGKLCHSAEQSNFQTSQKTTVPHQMSKTLSATQGLNRRGILSPACKQNTSSQLLLLCCWWQVTVPRKMCKQPTDVAAHNIQTGWHYHNRSACPNHQLPAEKGMMHSSSFAVAALCTAALSTVCA
jgi:hypothetical protein